MSAGLADRPLIDEAGDGLAPDERAALDALDPDGLRLTSLIVRKLRFFTVVGVCAGGVGEGSP